MLALIPAATSGSGTSSVYQASPAQFTTNREELFRIDHVVNDKLRGFYRFIYDSWATVSSSPTFNTNAFPTVQNSFAGPGIDMVANLTYAASPSLVNEFVADYTTDHITLLNISPGIGRQDFTPGGFFDNGYGGVLPSINVTGGTAYSGGFSVDSGYFPWKNSNPTYSYRDDLTKTLSKQTLIFGVSLIAAQKNEPSTGNNQGTLDLQHLFRSHHRQRLCGFVDREHRAVFADLGSSRSITTVTRSSSLTSRTTGVSPQGLRSTSACA